MIFRHAGVAIIYLFLKFFELVNRQWPEVYDLCPTFLHVARVRKQTDMRELHAQRAKKVQQNLIPGATAYWLI